MNPPNDIWGKIEPIKDGGRVFAWCPGCKDYKQLRNVRPWPGISEYYGECDCDSSLVGQPENPEPEPAA